MVANGDGTGEKKIEGVSTELIYNKLKDKKSVFYYKDKSELVKMVKERNKGKDGVILTIGAGDVHKLASDFIND